MCGLYVVWGMDALCRTFRATWDGRPKCVKTGDGGLKMGVEAIKDGADVFGIRAAIARNHLQAIILFPLG
ncbi:hypothetical protein JCM14076_15850 [Methylosoma difficile]